MGVLGGSRSTTEHPVGIPAGHVVRPTPPTSSLAPAISKELRFFMVIFYTKRIAYQDKSVTIFALSLYLLNKWGRMGGCAGGRAARTPPPPFIEYYKDFTYSGHLCYDMVA